MSKITRPKTGVIEREKQRQGAHKTAGTPDPARESSKRIADAIKAGSLQRPER